MGTGSLVHAVLLCGDHIPPDPRLPGFHGAQTEGVPRGGQKMTHHCPREFRRNTMSTQANVEPTRYLDN